MLKKIFLFPYLNPTSKIIVYRNPCTWYDSSQVELNSEENKIQLKSQNSFGSNGASVTSIAAALFAISCSSVT